MHTHTHARTQRKDSHYSLQPPSRFWRLSCTTIKKIRKSSIKEAATARVTLLLEDFLPSGLSTSEEDDNNDNDEETEAVDEESGVKEQQGKFVVCLEEAFVSGTEHLTTCGVLQNKKRVCAGFVVGIGVADGG